MTFHSIIVCGKHLQIWKVEVMKIVLGLDIIYIYNGYCATQWTSEKDTRGNI
jgi:hypothetical protein